ncbi:MAG: hypothetical protein DRI86_15750 [Bacteroidetes bacterium]|nr:MAG: hypothetical protein DRI86_15750 [Bacteroidota bacterium]
MKHFYFLLISFIFIFQSCEVINPDEDMPSFIKIDTMTFSANTGEGTSIAEIADAWVYVNGNLVGAFEMPFEIPVLSSGTSNIKISPGVKLNGIAGTRSINPFYTSYDNNMSLSIGETLNITPSCEYADGVIFPWNNRGEEDFEEGGISIDSIGDSSTSIKKSNTEVFEGNYSGYIELNSTHQTFYGQSTNAFVLPAGAGVVMEIHIKNDVPVMLGMFAYLPGGTVVSNDHLGVNAGSDWKKLYVNFTELVGNYPTATGYRVFFKSNIGDKTEANIYLDNIKIMHF